MKKCILAIGVAAALAASAATAEARIIVGLNFGIPICPRPIYAPVYYPYYRPYPVYVAPPPVYYVPPPVYVQPGPAPAVYQSAPSAYQAVPVVPNTAGYQQSNTVPVSANSGVDLNARFQQLGAQDERSRSEAAIELGRNKSQQAIDPLCHLLSSDPSPLVRDAAARALGLIGNARALNALQNAAQVDNDRDVRRSAQFSAEVIRASLR